jgi:hypothetical protein
VEIHGSLRIEVHADVDAGRVPCIADAVKGVADRRGMGFWVSDVASFYGKLKSLGAPEDLLEIFKEPNFVAITLMDAGTRINLMLYIDKESGRINRVELVTSIAKQYRAEDSIRSAVAELETVRKALDTAKEVLETVKSCAQ